MVEQSTRIEDLRAQIDAMEALASMAAAAEDYGPAVKARSEITRLRKELALAISEHEAEGETDPLARLARLRRGAAEAGSWVAASQLARQEEELRAKREAEARAAAEAAGEHLSDEEIIGAVVEHLAQMPAPLRERVLRELVERLAASPPDEDEEPDEA